MLKLPEVISEEEFIKVLDATKNVKHKLAFMLGFYECMRVSEVAALQPENIDYQLKLIMIKQAKGAKDRNIPIAPEVLKGLKHLPIDLTIRALQYAFKRKCKAILGRDALHFHSLRASGLTHYGTKKKWNAFELQRFAGHSKISTTQIYMNVRQEDLVNRMWGENQNE